MGVARYASAVAGSRSSRCVARASKAPRDADVLTAVGVGVHAEHEVLLTGAGPQPRARLGKHPKDVEARRAVGQQRDAHGPGTTPRGLTDALPDPLARDVQRDHLGTPVAQRLQRSDLRARTDQRDLAARQREPLGVLDHETDRVRERRFHRARLHPSVQLLQQAAALELAAAVGDAQGPLGSGGSAHLARPQLERGLERVQRVVEARHPLGALHDQVPAHRCEPGLGDRQRGLASRRGDGQLAQQAHVVAAPLAARANAPLQRGIDRCGRVGEDRAAGGARRAAPVHLRERHARARPRVPARADRRGDSCLAGAVHRT